MTLLDSINFPLLVSYGVIRPSASPYQFLPVLQLKTILRSNFEQKLYIAIVQNYVSSVG